MISRATPFMNPTITEFETKRMRRPRWRKPAISMKIPVRMVSMNRAPAVRALPVTVGTPATTSDIALVVCTLKKTELAKTAPTGVASITA